MASIGYIQVSAYVSRAQIPLKDVAITVTALDGTAIAMRLTDRSGKIVPIEIPVPDLSKSQSPNPGELPFARVNSIPPLGSTDEDAAASAVIFIPEKAITAAMVHTVIFTDLRTILSS